MNSVQDSGDFFRLGQMIKKHWLAGSLAFISVFSVGAIATFLRQNVYQAEAKLKLTPTASTVNPKIGNNLSRRDSFSMTPTASLLAVELAALRSPSLIEQTLATAQLKDAQGKPLPANRLRTRLRVSVIPTTDLVKVSYTSENPQQAATVVNTLVKNYLAANQAREREVIVAQRNLIANQLVELEQSIIQTESAIRKLQKTYDFVALAEKTKILLQSEQELTQSINQIQSELAKGQSKVDYLRQELELIAPANKNQVNNSLKQRLNQTSIQLAAENFGLQQQLVSLETSLADYQAEIRQIPQIEAQLNQLTKKAQAYQSRYDTVWQELENLKLNLKQDLATARVISDAVVTPSWIHSRPVGYLTASGIALLSAIGVITWRAGKDRSISTIEEAKKIYGDDWLGIIPNTQQIDRLILPDTESNLDSKRDRLIPRLVVRDYPSLPCSESYRILQSNLKFLRSEQTVKTISITSSAVCEGKSTIAANLACAMAQVGNRVLLVDANLHSPQQHAIWNTSNDPGLSNVVTEQLNPRIAIKSVMSNLDLLAAGTGLLASATLLDSQRMRMLIDYWSEQYDFVLFDTPSLGVAADATIMGRMTDGVLLVVRPGFVERSQANFAREILAQSGFNMLGVVFNGVASQFAVTPASNRALNSKNKKVPSSNQRQLQEAPPTIPDRLWENLNTTAIAHNVSHPQLPKNLDEQELQLAPLQQLETTVHVLQQDLGELTLLVKEQEEELFHQRQKVKQLQRQANIATENEYFNLEHQINQEQEKKRMLDQTLSGQRRNLSKRRQILHKYQEILASRKYSDSHSA